MVDTVDEEASAASSVTDIAVARCCAVLLTSEHLFLVGCSILSVRRSAVLFHGCWWGLAEWLFQPQIARHADGLGLQARGIPGD